MDMHNLTQKVKQIAGELGFDLSGVTTPAPPLHYLVYEGWLEAGYHGEMNYLGTDRARTQRANPRRILRECQSILVLGTPYPNPSSMETPKTDRPTGLISSYAWGNDYHNVLTERMKTLIAYIEDLNGKPVPNRWYTDTGPILERDLAHRAGLGWIGKNSMLINPRMGSYFFLSEILLGIKLEPAPRFHADRCGSCTRCIQACPTGCITDHRTIDSRRCISYLTIELKGPIPRPMRSLVGNRVFGCDVCQQVCPWNQRFASPQGDHEFDPRPEVPVIDLVEDLTLTLEGFNRKFKQNPVKRAKRRGYLRNVAVALGNTDGERAVDVLQCAMQTEPDPLVRGHIAWALGQINTPPAYEILRRAAQTETEDWILEEIQAWLGNN
jgi:epoxyqueuosine reductase